MIFSNVKDMFEIISINLLNDQYNKLTNYQELLLEWNNKINLTSITDDEEVWIKHFIDSCTIYEILNKYKKSESYSLIDVGTGAGFPSIPLKIIDEQINVTMIDSLNKRINFLNEVINKLDLKNINAIHGRSEDLSHEKSLREQFDFATARAVANLSTLLEYCLPFVKVDGYFICMKGSNVEVEINNCKNALKKLGGEIVEIKKLNLPIINDERNIIVIKKIKNTPIEYARKAGVPAKNPL